MERQKYWLSICCGQKDGFGLQKNGFVGRSILRGYAFEALRHLRMKTVSELEQYHSYKRLQKHREQLGLEHESVAQVLE